MFSRSLTVLVFATLLMPASGLANPLDNSPAIFGNMRSQANAQALQERQNNIQKIRNEWDAEDQAKIQNLAIVEGHLFQLPLLPMSPDPRPRDLSSTYPSD